MSRPPRLNNSGLPLYHLTRVGPPASLPQVPDTMDLYRVTTVIGRNAIQADFVLDSTNRIRSGYISRLHARIIREGEIHHLRDDSLNGVFINHIKIGGGCVLQEGDLVTFGHPNGSNILVGTLKRQSDSEYQFLFTRCDCQLQIDPPAPLNEESKLKTPAVSAGQGDGVEGERQAGVSSSTDTHAQTLPKHGAPAGDVVKSGSSISAGLVKDTSVSPKKRAKDLNTASSSKSKQSRVKSASEGVNPNSPCMKTAHSLEKSDTVVKCCDELASEDLVYVVKDSMDTSQESDLNREYLESDSVDYQGEAADEGSQNEDTGRNAGTDTEVSVPPSTGSRTDEEGQSDACLTDEAPIEVIVISSESESEEVDNGGEIQHHKRSRDHMECIEICGDSENSEPMVGHALKHEPCDPSPVFKKPKLFPEDSKGSDNDKTSPVFSTVVCKTKPPKRQHQQANSSKNPRKKSTKSWCFSAPIAVASPTYKLSDSSYESSQSSEDESVPSLELFSSEPAECSPTSADDAKNLSTRPVEDGPSTDLTSDLPPVVLSEDDPVEEIRDSECSAFAGVKNSSILENQDKDDTSVSTCTSCDLFKDNDSVMEGQDPQLPQLNSNQSNALTPDLFESASPNVNSEDIVGHSDKACATSQLSSSQQSEGITEYEENGEQHISTEFIQQVMHHAKQELGKMDEVSQSETLQKEPFYEGRKKEMLVPDFIEGLSDESIVKTVTSSKVTELHESISTDAEQDTEVAKKTCEVTQQSALDVEEVMSGEGSTPCVPETPIEDETLLQLSEAQSEPNVIKPDLEMKQSGINITEPEGVVSQLELNVTDSETNVIEFGTHVTEPKSNVTEERHVTATEVDANGTEADTNATEADTNMTEADTNVTEAGTNVTEADTNVTEAGTNVTEAGTNVTEADTNVTEAGTNVTEAGTNVTEAGTNVTEAGTNVTEADTNVTEAGTNMTESDTNVTEAGRNVTEAGTNVTEADTNVTEAGTNVTEAGTNVTEADTNVTEAGTNVTEAGTNVTEADTNVTEAGTNVTEAGTNVTEAGTNVTEAGTNVTEADTNVTEAGTNMTESDTNVTEAGTNVTEAGTNVTEAGTNVTEAGTNVTEAGTNVTEADTNVTEADTNVTEADTNVTEADTNVTEADTNVTEAGTNVTEAGTNVTEAGTNVTEAGTNVTEADTNVTEADTNMTEANTNVTEADTNVTEAGTNVTEADTNVNAADTNMTEADTNVTEAGTNMTEANTNVTEADTNITEADTNVTEADTNVTDEAHVTVTDTNVTEADTNMTQANTHVTVTNTNVTEEATVTEADVTEAEADVTEAEADVTEAEADVTEADVTQPQPNRTQAEPETNVAFPEPNVTQAELNVSEAESHVSQYEPDMTEEEPNVLNQSVQDHPQSGDIIKEQIMNDEEHVLDEEKTEDFTTPVTIEREFLKSSREEVQVNEEQFQEEVDTNMDSSEPVQDAEKRIYSEELIHNSGTQVCEVQVQDEVHPLMDSLEPDAEDNINTEDVVRDSLEPVSEVKDSVKDTIRLVKDDIETSIESKTDALGSVSEDDKECMFGVTENNGDDESSSEDEIIQTENVSDTMVGTTDIQRQTGQETDILSQVEDDTEQDTRCPVEDVNEQMPYQQHLDEHVVLHPTDLHECIKDVQEQDSSELETVEDVLEQTEDLQETVEDVEQDKKGPVQIDLNQSTNQIDDDVMDQVVHKPESVEVDMTDGRDLQENVENDIKQALDNQDNVQVEDVVEKELRQQDPIDDLIEEDLAENQEPIQAVRKQETDQQESVEDVAEQDKDEVIPEEVSEQRKYVQEDNLDQQEKKVPFGLKQTTDREVSFEDDMEQMTDQQKLDNDGMELGVNQHIPIENVMQKVSDYKECNEDSMEQNQQDQVEDDMAQVNSVDNVKEQDGGQLTAEDVIGHVPDQQISVEDDIVKNVSQESPVDDVMNENIPDGPEPIHDVTELVEHDLVEDVTEKVFDQQDAVAHDIKELADQQGPMEATIELHEDKEESVEDVAQQGQVEAINDQEKGHQKSTDDELELEMDQRELARDIMDEVAIQKPIEVVMEQLSIQHESEDIAVKQANQEIEDAIKKVTDNHGLDEDVLEHDHDQQEPVEDVMVKDPHQHEPIHEPLEQSTDQDLVENVIEECTGTVEENQFEDNDSELGYDSGKPLNEYSDSTEPSVANPGQGHTTIDQEMNEDGIDDEETTRSVTFEAPVVPSDSELKLITSIDECIAETMPTTQAEDYVVTKDTCKDYDSKIPTPNQMNQQLVEDKDQDDVNCEDDRSIATSIPSETCLIADESQGFCLGTSPLIPLSQEEEDKLLADDSMEVVPSCSTSDGVMSEPNILNIVSSLLADLVEQASLRGTAVLEDEDGVDSCNTEIGQELNQETNIIHTNNSLKVNVSPQMSEEDELSPIIPQQAETGTEHQDLSGIVDNSVLDQEEDVGSTPDLHLHLSQADPEPERMQDEELVGEENGDDVDSTQDLHLFLSQVGTEDFSGSDEDPEEDIRSATDAGIDLPEDFRESALDRITFSEGQGQSVVERCEESMATSETTYPSFDLSCDVDDLDHEQNKPAPETLNEAPVEMLNVPVEQAEGLDEILDLVATVEDNTGTIMKLPVKEVDNFETIEEASSEDKESIGDVHDFDNTAENVDLDKVEQNKTDCFNEKSLGCDTNATLSTSSDDHKISHANETAENIHCTSDQTIPILETTVTEEHLSDEEFSTSFKDPHEKLQQSGIPFAKNIVASTPKKSYEGLSDSASTVDSLMVQTDDSSYQKDLSRTRSETSTENLNNEQTVIESTNHSDTFALNDRDVRNPDDEHPETSDDNQLSSDENCINLQLSGIESQASDVESHTESQASQTKIETEKGADGNKSEDMLDHMRDEDQDVFKTPLSETDRNKAKMSEHEQDLLGSITGINSEENQNESENPFSDEELHLEISASDESHVPTEEPMNTSSDCECVSFVSPIIKFQGTARDVNVTSKPNFYVDESINTSSESDTVSLISPVIKFIGIPDSSDKSHQDSSVSLPHSGEKAASVTDTSTSQVNLMKITASEDAEDPTLDSFHFMRSPNDPDTCSQESMESESELNISGVVPFELSDTEQNSVIEVKVDKREPNMVDSTDKNIGAVGETTCENREPPDVLTGTPARDTSTPEKDTSTNEKEANIYERDTSISEREASTPERYRGTNKKDVNPAEEDTSSNDGNESTPEKDASHPEKDTITNDGDASTPEKDTITNDGDASTPEKDTCTNEKIARTKGRDASSPTKDASSPEIYSSTNERDASNSEKDRSTPEKDASTPERDASLHETDKSTPERNVTSSSTTKDTPEQTAQVFTVNDYKTDIAEQAKNNEDDPLKVIPVAVGADHENAVKLYMSPTDMEPAFTAQPLFKVDDNNVIIFDAEMEHGCSDANEKQSQGGDGYESANSASTTIRLYNSSDEPSPVFFLKSVSSESPALCVNDHTSNVAAVQSMPEDQMSTSTLEHQSSSPQITCMKEFENFEKQSVETDSKETEHSDLEQDIENCQKGQPLFEEEQKSQHVEETEQGDEVEKQEIDYHDVKGQSTENLNNADDNQELDADIQRSQSVETDQKSEAYDKESSRTDDGNKEVKETKNLPKKENNDDLVTKSVEDIAEERTDIKDNCKEGLLGKEKNKLTAAVEVIEEKEENDMTHEDEKEGTEDCTNNRENTFLENKSPENSKQNETQNIHFTKDIVGQENENQYLQTLSYIQANVNSPTCLNDQDIHEDNDKENKSPAHKRRTSEDDRKLLKQMNMVNYVDSFPESEDIEIIDLTEEPPPVSSCLTGTDSLPKTVEVPLKDEPDGLCTGPPLEPESECDTASIRKSSSEELQEEPTVLDTANTTEDVDRSDPETQAVVDLEPVKHQASRQLAEPSIVKIADPQAVVAIEDQEPLIHQSFEKQEAGSSEPSVVKGVTRKRKASDEASGLEKRFCERDVLMRDTTFMKKLVAHFFSIRGRVKRRTCDENQNIKNVTTNDTDGDVGIKTEISNDLISPSIGTENLRPLKIELKTESSLKDADVKEEPTSDKGEQVISPKKEEAWSGEELNSARDNKCPSSTVNESDIIIISESDSEGASYENVQQNPDEVRLTCDEISLGSPEIQEKDNTNRETRKELASGDSHEEMTCDEYHEEENAHHDYDNDVIDMKSDETETNGQQSTTATSPEPSAGQTSDEEDDSTAPLDQSEDSDDGVIPSDHYKSVQSSESSLNLAQLSSDDYEVYTDENTPELISPVKGQSLKEVSSSSLDLKSKPCSSNDQDKTSGHDSGSSLTDRSSLSVHTLGSDYDSDVYITEYSPPYKPLVKIEDITSDDEDDMNSNSRRSAAKHFSLKGNNSKRSSDSHQGSSSKFQRAPGKDDERSDQKAEDAITEYFEDTAMQEMDENIEQGDLCSDPSSPLEKLKERDQFHQTLIADVPTEKEDYPGSLESAHPQEPPGVDQSEEASSVVATTPSGTNKDALARSSSAYSLVADFSEDTDSISGPEVNIGDLIGMLEEEEEEGPSKLTRSASLEDIFQSNSERKSNNLLEKSDCTKETLPLKKIKAAAEAIVEKELPENSTRESTGSPFKAATCLSLGRISPEDRSDSAHCSPDTPEDERKTIPEFKTATDDATTDDLEKMQIHDNETNQDVHETIETNQDDIETESDVYPDTSQPCARLPSSSVESEDSKEDFPQLSGQRKRARRSSDDDPEVDGKRHCVEIVVGEEDIDSNMSELLLVNDDNSGDESLQPALVSEVSAFGCEENNQIQHVQKETSNDQIRNNLSERESEDEASEPYLHDDSDSNISMPVLEKEIDVNVNKCFKNSSDIEVSNDQKDQVSSLDRKSNNSKVRSPLAISDNIPQRIDLTSDDPSHVDVQPSTSKADSPADSQAIHLAVEDLSNTQISQLDRKLAATDNPENKKRRSILDKIRAKRKGSATYQKTEVPVPVPVPVTPGELSGSSSIQRNIFQSESQQKVKKMEDCVARCLNVTRLLQQTFQENERLHDMANVKVWWEELQEIAGKVQLPRTVIAVVGDTGSGKSSMLNALLHEPRVLPTSGVEACTAVVVEVSENSLNNKYEADIHFLSPEEWQDELKVLLKDLTKMNGELQKRQPDPQSEAGVAFAKVRAVYGKVDSMEALRQQRDITQWLGRVKRVRVATAKELRDKVNTYIESRDTVSKSGQFWPIVKRVELRLPSCEACSSGAILVDLPGVRDANAARDRIAREYLKDCTSVWVVAEIHRAKDNRTAKELLDENFRRQLLMDGQFSSVAFICTKTDSLIPSELKSLLALPSQFDELSDEVSGLGDEIQSLSERKAAQQAECRTLRSRFKTLKAEYNEMDAEITEAREAILLEEDEEAAAEIQEAEQELEGKEQEMKQTHAHIDGILSEVDTLSRQITQITIKQEQIQRDVAVMCAKARNDHAKKQIKKGFRAGIRELKRRSSNLTEEEDIEDYDDGESDDEDGEEMSSIINNLKVFCTSSADYQRMTKLLTDGDGGAKVFSSPEETQIPALRDFVHSTTLKRREHGVRQMVERVGHFILNIDSYLKMSQLGNKESRQAQPVVNKHLQALKTRVETIVADLGDDIADIYSSQIFGQLEAGSKIAAMKARPTSDKWGQKVNRANRDQGGFCYQTYLAVVRRYGRFKSPTAGCIDFNEQLSDPLLKALSCNWDKIFGAQIWRCLDKVRTSMNCALEDFSKDIRRDFHSEEVDPLQIDCALRQIIRIATAKLAEMTELMKEYISTQQKEISRLVTPKIKESMSKSYVAMTMESGPGSFARMKKTMADSVDTGCGMFDTSASEIHDRLTKLQESVCARVKGVLLALCGSFKVSFLPLWQSASTFENIRKHLAQTVYESLVLVQQLYKDIGLTFPEVTESAPELDSSLPMETEETVDEVLGALRHDVEDQVKKLEAVSEEEEVIALPGQTHRAGGHKPQTLVKKEPEPHDEFSFSRHIQESGKTMLREVQVEGQVSFWNKSFRDSTWTPGTLQVLERNGEWSCFFHSTASPARNKSFQVSRKVIKHLEHTKRQLIIELTNGLGVCCFSHDSKSLQQANRLLRAIVDGTTDLISRDEPATVMRSMATGKRVVVTGLEVSPDASSTVPGSTSISDILQTDADSTTHSAIAPQVSPDTSQRVLGSTTLQSILQKTPDPKTSCPRIILVNPPSASNTGRTTSTVQSVPSQRQQSLLASSQGKSKMFSGVNLQEEPKPIYKSLIAKQMKDPDSSSAPTRCPQYKHKLGKHSVGTFSAVGKPLQSPATPSSQSSVSKSSSGFRSSGISQNQVRSSVTPKKIPRPETTSGKIVSSLLTSSNKTNAKLQSSQSVYKPAGSIDQPSRPESLQPENMAKKQRVTRITQPSSKRPNNDQSSFMPVGKKVEGKSSRYFKLYQPETVKLNPPETPPATKEATARRTLSAKATASATLGTSNQNNPSRVDQMDTGRRSLKPLKTCSTQNQASTLNQASTKIQTSTQNQPSGKHQASATNRPTEASSLSSSQQKSRHGKSLSLKSQKRPAPVEVKQEPLDEVAPKRSRLEDDEVMIISDAESDPEDITLDPCSMMDNNPVASGNSNIHPLASNSSHIKSLTVDNSCINPVTCDKSSSNQVASDHSYDYQEPNDESPCRQESMESSDDSSSDDDLPSFL